ncbi:MAG TPA: flagellar motor protein MotB [Gemmatimonadales bacterium]|nr:flagellar motor protein MotB [Gemmatimonadales bacterium]
MKTDREKPVVVVRRPRVHRGGHHGGAWKVAYADFTTSMMSLFLVLWLMTQSPDVRAAVAGYFRDPMGRERYTGNSASQGGGTGADLARLQGNRTLMEMDRAHLRALGDRLRRDLEKTPEWARVKNQVEIELTHEGLRIQLLEDSAGTFFQTGSSRPSEGGAALIRFIGSELAALPNAVVVEGHTDSRPYPSQNGYTNWELSADRANAARRILDEGGLRPQQVRHIRGYADTQLRMASDPLAPSNRRVTILMLLASDSAVAEGASAAAETPVSPSAGAPGAGPGAAPAAGDAPRAGR